MMEIDQAVKALTALSQETRLQVCTLLKEAGEGGMTAGDISLALGVAQNTLSFHLSHLENAGLVNKRRQGRFIIYSHNARTIDNLILYLAQTCRQAPA